MSILNSRDERNYVQVVTPYVGQIPNAAGTASVGNGDAIRLVKLALDAETPTIQSAAKTGALGRLAGFTGQRGGKWSAEMPFQLSGAAGTKPDMDPFLEAIFGLAGVVSAGVSVSYALADVISELALWSYLTPATAYTPHRVGWGALLDEF